MTYAELMALWDVRDMHYTTFKHTFRSALISDAGRSAAVEWRKKEIDMLLTNPEDKRVATERLNAFAKGNT